MQPDGDPVMPREAFMDASDDQEARLDAEMQGNVEG